MQTIATYLLEQFHIDEAKFTCLYADRRLRAMQHHAQSLLDVAVHRWPSAGIHTLRKLHCLQRYGFMTLLFCLPSVCEHP